MKQQKQNNLKSQNIRYVGKYISDETVWSHFLLAVCFHFSFFFLHKDASSLCASLCLSSIHPTVLCVQSGGNRKSFFTNLKRQPLRVAFKVPLKTVSRICRDETKTSEENSLQVKNKTVRPFCTSDFHSFKDYELIEACFASVPFFSSSPAQEATLRGEERSLQCSARQHEEDLSLSD